MALIEWVNGVGRPPSGVDDAVDPEHDIAAALAALTSFQQVTQHLDSKVNALLGVQLGLLGLLGSRAGGFLDVVRTHDPGPLVWVFTGVLSGVLIGTGLLVFSAFRSRTAQYSSFNHWALPGSSGIRPPNRPPPGELADQAWAAAEAVGRIAVAKHQYLNRAGPGVILSVVLGLTWLLIFP